MSVPLSSTRAFDTPVLAYPGGQSECQSFVSGITAFAEGPFYGHQQIQRTPHYEAHSVFPTENFGNARHEQHTYATKNLTQKGPGVFSTSQRDAIRHPPSKSVRRRISRACDQCNQLRTKCDGKSPCAHCVELSITCEYVRERKKRGKASKKDLALRTSSTDTMVAGNESGGTFSPSSQSAVETSPKKAPAISRVGRTKLADNKRHRAPMSSVHGSSRLGSTSRTPSTTGKTNHSSWPMSLDSVPASSASYPVQSELDNHVQEPLFKTMSNSSWLAPGLVQEPEAILDFQYMDSTIPNTHEYLSNGHARDSSMPANGRPVFASVSRRGSHDLQMGAHKYPDSDDMPPSLATEPGRAASSTSWLAPSSPMDTLFSTNQERLRTLRYPALQPLVPFLDPLVPCSLACDLLEFYFASTASFHPRPRCPHLPCFVFEKDAFLRATQPRVSTPALLASMLWIAAQTSEAPFLTSHSSVRELVCQKLFDTTIALLKAAGNSKLMDNQDCGSSIPSGTLDDVVTYLHLASVASATEYKNISLQWWTTASSLASNLGVHREVSPCLAPLLRKDQTVSDGHNGLNDQRCAAVQHDLFPTGQEQRDERQRAFWMMCMLDRHFALCNNRPIFFVTKDCEHALQSIGAS